MSSVNKVILIGHLAADPEIRYTQNGKSVAHFRMATNETWKDKVSGEQQERTEWHRVVAFRRLAEIAKDYLHKGSKVYVEGKLRTRQWEDSQSVTHYMTEVLINEMQMLDAKPQAVGNQQVVQDQVANVCLVG